MVDPFYKYKDAVQKNLSTLRSQADKWLEAIARKDTIQIAGLAASIEDTEQAIEGDLEDLEETISIVQQDLQRWHIDQQELNNRKAFIENARKNLREIKIYMQKQKEQVEKQAKRKITNAVQDAIYRENEEFIQGELSQQERIYKDMDSDFDRLHDTVGRLGEVGRVMREELEEQNLVLEEFGVEADDTQSMLGQATKSVEKLIQAAKKGGLTYCIIILLIILILLVIISFSV